MFTAVAQAADVPYVLLEPVPGIGAEGKITSYGEYFSGIYNTALVLVVALAVIMVVVGGIQYSASSINPGLKEEGKGRITAAIGGLLLALFSFLILTTINPRILDNTSIGIGDSGPGPGSGPSGGGASCQGYSGPCGGPSNMSDDEGRAALLGDGKDGISSLEVKEGGLPDCEVVGFGNTCGYFQGMKKDLVEYTKNIRARCPDCKLVARDATGPRHSSAKSAHYKGEALDFHPTESLTNYITKNFTDVGGTGPREHATYRDPVNGTIWVYEKFPDNVNKNHWHAQLDPEHKDG